MRSHRSWLLLVLAVQAAIALAAAHVAGLAGLLVAGPLLAARRLSTPATTLVTVASLLLTSVLPGADGGPDRLMAVLVVAVAGAAAIMATRARARGERSLAGMTRIAEHVQRAVIRPLPARLGDIALAVHSHSATEQALIGGDLHDAIVTPTAVRLVVGDAKGNGMAAVRQAAAVLAAFRRHAAIEPDPVGLALTLDACIAADLGAEDFVTLLIADFADGEVRLVNCGHPAPLRVGRRLDLLEPPQPSPPLGLDPRPRLQRMSLGRGHRLLLYTDGLTDVRTPASDTFSLRDERVRAALTAPGLDDALVRLLDLLRACGHDTAHDDLTLILAQPAPAPVPGPAAPADDRRPGAARDRL